MSKLDDMIAYSIDSKCAARCYLDATTDDMIALFENLLDDLNNASTLLQTLAAFKRCREGATALIADRRRARAILNGGDDS